MFGSTIMPNGPIQMLIGIAVAINLASCSDGLKNPSGQEPHETKAESENGDNAPFAVSALSRQMPPMLSSITGSLVFSDGCLRVDNGNFAYPVVWAAGTRWDARTRRIRDPRTGGAAAVGTEIELQGGAVTVDESINEELSEPLPESCLGRVWMGMLNLPSGDVALRATIR
ncbi:hypothetical protein ACIGGE_16095 [Qipengyuania sp. NPDC077410]|uniref:hypothetical protein n=1 Tax=Qipengyuania sp. NPDC077410 TaxID=3364496 RepID=UPI0037CAF31C